MNEIGRRAFSEADQRAFVALSGDANPIHLDVVAARRTVFGRCVVHGVHQMLWALDVFIGARSGGGCAPVALEAKFLQALGLDVRVACSVDEDDGRQFALKLVQDGVVITRLKGTLGDSPAGDVAVSASRLESGCRPRSFEELPGTEGELDLFLEPRLSTALFPALTQRWPRTHLAGILAATRLVGMECPGLHSIFVGLELRFHEPAGEPRLRWRVAHAAQHLGIVNLAVEGCGVHGTLKTIFRPLPRIQAGMTEVAQSVIGGEYSGQRALIVGGSRGLGEVAAKILACGGGAVCLTYCHGEADAQRVCAEIGGAGGDASAVRFDALNDALPALPWPPTHLYYFATPLITPEKTAAFSARKFEMLCQYYVGGLARALLGTSEVVGGELTVFYPSTSFLDEAAPAFAEYCAAKAAGEALGRQFAHRFPKLKFHAPRLPRMTTDQTAGLLPVAAEDPLTILLPTLRALRSP